MKLGLVAILFAVIVGLPLGVVSALRQNSWIDYASLFTSTLGISVPTFVSGLLLLIFLSQRFNYSPIRVPRNGKDSAAPISCPASSSASARCRIIARLTRVDDARNQTPRLHSDRPRQGIGRTGRWSARTCCATR